MTWARSSISADGTHHVADGRPLYSPRFQRVQKFHEPGLAPVVDRSGAYHIGEDGAAAYGERFRQAWGFYEGRAAVEDAEGWLHILPDGTPLSSQRFAWCGNFQEGRCTVRTLAGRYHHLAESGDVAYTDQYLYAGDFRDGAAVVRCPVRGLCTHIDPDGSLVHGEWFIDLDVFHKGFARARDPSGWFHISRAGVPINSRRDAEVEPFYNGQARVLTKEGRFVVIDEFGVERAEVGAIPRTSPGGWQ